MGRPTSGGFQTRSLVSCRLSMFERYRYEGSRSYVLGNNLTSLRRQSAQLVVIDTQLDLERRGRQGEKSIWVDEQSRAPSLSGRLNATDPFRDLCDTQQNPLNDGSNTKGLQHNLNSEQPYHVFAKRQKWSVVLIIGVAGLFSGLSSNIYNPALNSIAQDLNISLGTVYLTITSYLIVQGISPFIWGSISDSYGRRPIYMACFTVYIIANIALSFSPNFAVLLIFRGLQAAGSASLPCLGNGVIQDIAPSTDRASFLGFYQAIRNFSIAIGPVLGGILSDFLGFRSIFVLLFTLSSIVVLTIMLFLPETMRLIAGNGSWRQSGIYKPVIYKLTRAPVYWCDPEESVKPKKITIQTFVEPLRLFARKEIVVNLIFGGIIVAVGSMVTCSTTSLFQSSFQLNDTLLGLCFVPTGLGSIVGSTMVGKLMTRDFRAAEDSYKKTHQLPLDYKFPPENLPLDFPIAKTRQRNLPWLTTLFVVCTTTYGFSMSSPTLTSRLGWIAIPLVLQFLIAATGNSIFAMNQTLISDLCPGRGASGTGVNNLIRCGLGAIGVAFLQKLILAVGPGPTFLGLSLVIVICSPLAVMSWVWGMKWRAARMQREGQIGEKV